MIVLDVEQRSAEWERARLGIPTSSEFHRIVTPKQLQYAAKADTYLFEILAEWVTGHALEQFVSKWADRGHEIEPEARRAYTFETGLAVETVGLCYRDEERMVACSPDGLVGEEGGIEIKCPAAKTHIGNLLCPEDFIQEHRMQVQGSLWVTGRKWWDLMSYYSPMIPPAILRVHPEPDVQAALDKYVGGEFLARLRALRTKLLDLGIVPRLNEDATVVPEWALPSVDHLQKATV